MYIYMQWHHAANLVGIKQAKAFSCNSQCKEKSIKNALETSTKLNLKGI